MAKDLIKAKKDITHLTKEEPTEEEVDNLDGVTTVIVPPSLKVGDAVEARYRGESNFFPGKIIQKHPNGSYDILYDDGDQEKGVSGDLIRAIDTSTNVFVDQPGEHMSTSAKGNKNALQSIRHYMSIIEDAQRKIRTHLDALE